MKMKLFYLTFLFTLLILSKGSYSQNPQIFKEIESSSVPGAVFFSPDEKSIASIDIDLNLRLWNIQSGKLINTFPNHLKISFAKFSPDGRYLATAISDNSIKLFDVDNGIELMSFIGHTDRVTNLTYSPDGKTLASCSFDRSIKIWDIQKLELSFSFPYTEKKIFSIDFNSDGSKILSNGGDKYNEPSELILWDVKNRKMERKYENTKFFNSTAKFSQDDKYILSTRIFDSKFVVTNTETGTVERDFPLEASKSYKIVKTKDPNTIFCSNNLNTIKILSLNGVFESIDIKYENGISSFDVSPDGKYFATSSGLDQNDKNIKIWEISKLATVNLALSKFYRENNISKDQESNILASTLNSVKENLDNNLFLYNNSYDNKFIQTSNGKCYLIQNNKLFVKLNSSGDKWGAITEDIRRILIDPKNPEIFYAITKGNQVRKSMNGCESWITIQNGIPSGVGINNMVINPHNNLEIFLTTANGIYKTTDAGFYWQPVKIGSLVTDLIIHPNNKNRFYALSAEGVILSDDAGMTWTIISNTLPQKLIKGTGRTASYTTINVNRIVNVSYPNSEFLFASTENGLFKTTDDGKTWILISEEFSREGFISSIYFTNNEIFLGYCVLDNKTNKWNYSLLKSDIFGTKIQRVAIKANNIGYISGVYKEKKHPGIFIQAQDRISYIDSSSNVIGLNYGVTTHSKIKAFNVNNIANQQIMYAIVQNDDEIDIERHGLWKSTNNGISWESCLLYSDGTYGNGSGMIGIVVSPLNSLEVYLFDYDNWGQFNYASFDGGNTWVTIEQRYNISGRIYDFSFDNKDPNLLYFAFRVPSSYVTCLYRYDKRTGGATRIHSDCSSFMFAKNNSLNIFTYGKDNNTGFNVSIDGGWTWNSIQNIDSTINIKKYYYTYLKPIYYEENFLLIIVDESLLLSKDNGKNWELLKSFNLNICSAFVNKKNKDNLVVFLIDNSGNTTLLETTDLKAWNLIGGDHSGYNNVTYLPLDENNEKLIYIYGNSGISKTQNDGKNWEKIGGINENN